MIELSVCCCTYNRPEMLGELIESFERQTYPKDKCEMIVLDDAGQYDDIRGENWQVVSFPRRFASLGEKRNACVSLTSPESKYIVVADDDDIYLPHWLESHANNFERGAKWSFAGSIFWSIENMIVGQWHYRGQEWIMHPAHAYCKDLFWQVGGYPHIVWKEDHEFFKRLTNFGEIQFDAIGHSHFPYLISRRTENKNHVHTTCMDLETYRLQSCELPKAKPEIGWRRDYLKDALDHRKEYGEHGNILLKVQ